MRESQVGISERLTPKSRYSLDDLVERSGEIVEDWAAQRAHDSHRPPSAIKRDLARTLSAVGRWIGSRSSGIDEGLLEVFRELAFAYRSRGYTLGEALEDLELLEDLLTGELPERIGEETQPSLQFRRAMRALWTETVHLSHSLDRRRHRETAEALETFEEIVSHELGNRLGAARTGVEILRESAPALSEARRAELLDLIAEGVDAALQTVDDVSSFVQTQRWDEDVAPLDEVLASVAAGVKATARAAGVRLDVAEEVPPVEVDSGRLRLVLSNLLVNGVRYSDPDEPRPRVRLRAAAVDGQLTLEVEDNGVGIAEEDQVRIFQYRGRGDVDGGVDGSGLGLTIVREAVTQMGGHIVVDSQRGVGSTFRVILPLDPDRGLDSDGGS